MPTYSVGIYGNEAHGDKQFRVLVLDRQHTSVGYSNSTVYIFCVPHAAKYPQNQPDASDSRMICLSVICQYSI